MKSMDVKVYAKHRKHGKFPGFEANPDASFTLYRDVPILPVSPERLNRAVTLQELDIIRLHRDLPLLILTDHRRILAIDPQGYDYARYVCVIDAQTGQNILRLV